MYEYCYVLYSISLCVCFCVSTMLAFFLLFCFAFQDLFIFMCMNIFPACMSVYHMHAVTQKRASDPLELELQTVVSPQGTENQTQFICKAPQVLWIAEPSLRRSCCFFSLWFCSSLRLESCSSSVPLSAYYDFDCNSGPQRSVLTFISATVIKYSNRKQLSGARLFFFFF